MTMLVKPVEIKLYGHFRMRVYEHRGGRRKKILDWNKKNQITNQGREAVLILMCPFGYSGTPDAQTENRIWSLSAGTNGTLPTINDDDGTMSAVWTSQFIFPAECSVSATPPNSFYLQITKVMPLVSSADGNVLREAGVFTRGDNGDPGISSGRKLYARQVHTPIEKTSTMTIEYGWQLGISIQS